MLSVTLIGVIAMVAAKPTKVIKFVWYIFRFICLVFKLVKWCETGWRLDYFLVSQSIAANVHDSYILPDINGSDHCPIGLILKL